MLILLEAYAFRLCWLPSVAGHTKQDTHTHCLKQKQTKKATFPHNQIVLDSTLAKFCARDQRMRPGPHLSLPITAFSSSVLLPLVDRSVIRLWLQLPELSPRRALSSLGPSVLSRGPRLALIGQVESQSHPRTNHLSQGLLALIGQPCVRRSTPG